MDDGFFSEVRTLPCGVLGGQHRHFIFYFFIIISALRAAAAAAVRTFRVSLRYLLFTLICRSLFWLLMWKILCCTVH